MPVWNDKMAGQQAANSAFTCSLLLFNGNQSRSSKACVLQLHFAHAFDMNNIIVFCIIGFVVQMKSAYLKQLSPYQLYT